LIGSRLDIKSIIVLKSLHPNLEVHFNSPYYNERRLYSCFYTRDNINDKNIILGYPIMIEYYNNSSVISNIDFGLELLSLDAFKRGCRKTNLNQKFSLWLPVITPNCYNKENNKFSFNQIIKQFITYIAISNKTIRGKIENCDLFKTKYNNNNENDNDNENDNENENDNDNDNENDNDNVIENDLLEEEYQNRDDIDINFDINIKAYKNKIACNFLIKDRLNYLKSKMEYPELYYEEFVIDILSNLMSSAVVKMLSNTYNISYKALEGYSRIHYLFCYLSKQNPKIEELINKKIKDFKNNIRSRHKSKIPNLGKFLSYLSISNKYKWDDIQEEYLDETYKRNIYWILKECPNFKPKNENDCFYYLDKLDKIWNIVQTGKRLCCFYFYFLNYVARPRGMTFNDIIENYNYYYGLPPRNTRDDFYNTFKKINNISSFKEFYEFIGIKYRGDKYISQQLTRAYFISNKIGYNNQLS
jgi:hypothetical protein